MSLLFNVLTVIFVSVGAVFFLAGTLGLLRFPDVYTRLHALTKADNTGLGLIVVGMMFQADSVLTILKMVLIWIFVLISGATAAHLISTTAYENFVRTENEENEK